MILNMVRRGTDEVGAQRNGPGHARIATCHAIASLPIMRPQIEHAVAGQPAQARSGPPRRLAAGPGGLPSRHPKRTRPSGATYVPTHPQAHSGVVFIVLIVLELVGATNLFTKL